MGLFKTRFTQRWIFLGVLGALTACGGGGGSSSSVPAPSSVALSSVVVSSSLASSSAESSSSAASVLPLNRTPDHARWSFKANAKIRSTAAVTDSSVIFGSETGRLYALDLQTGAEQWSLDTGGAISSQLLLADGKVIFLALSGKVMAVNAATGVQVWSLNTGAEYYRAWGYHLASALLVGDRIYIGTSSGKLYGLALATGEQQWMMDLKSAIHTKPTLVDGILYVSSDTAVHALDIATSKQLWSVPLQMPASPAVANNTLVVGSRGFFVHAFDATTGAERWKLSHGIDWVSGGAAIVEGVVYIGSSDSKKYQAIELDTGKLKWEVGTGTNVFATPAFNGDISYISSGNSYSNGALGHGMVRAVNKAGQLVWSLSGKNFFASPIVKDDLVYIGSDDGFFYAFPAQ